jgi:2-oxoglutarate/2-oxoacid ferredoxin oxidoreductase subunit alpha
MASEKKVFSEEISIVICGEAGQGINTIESILVNALKSAGYNLFATKEYMSRVRGGSNSTMIRVSRENVKAMVRRIDLLIALDQKAIGHVGDRLSGDTVVMGDPEVLRTDRPLVPIPFLKAAKDLGNPIYANTVACGVVFGLFGDGLETLEKYLTGRFGKKSADVAEKNVAAARMGYEVGKGIYDSGVIQVKIPAQAGIGDHLFMSGTDAVGFGALYGGCNFIASYPMSPGTGVLNFLMDHAREMEVAVEQAEDEIAAINMGIGAWYAGARALVTTSGGGFALMGEGLSLAGITETPVVIHLAQRPGPATGLPTRTEQGDLELALYSGHGDFPRILLAPADLEGAPALTARAFDLADRFQVPVIILTDQYFLDSYYNTKEMEKTAPAENRFIATGDDYLRYRLTEDGISPRGIPGLGTGMVAVDSDEHDEGGRITESEEVRNRMVEKRHLKEMAIGKEAPEPRFSGDAKYETLVIGWGSTHNTIAEAIRLAGLKKTAHLHFTQVHPLPAGIGKYLSKAKQTIIVENNSNAQFAKLLKLATGIDVDRKILKYSGWQFSVEELAKKLKGGAK